MIRYSFFIIFLVLFSGKITAQENYKIIASKENDWDFLEELLINKRVFSQGGWNDYKFFEDHTMELNMSGASDAYYIYNGTWSVKRKLSFTVTREDDVITKTFYSFSYKELEAKGEKTSVIQFYTGKKFIEPERTEAEKDLPVVMKNYDGYLSLFIYN